MPRKYENLVGKTFGVLLVESFSIRKTNIDYYNCTCQCGRTVVVSANSLMCRNTTSCLMCGIPIIMKCT